MTSGNNKDINYLKILFQNGPDKQLAEQIADFFPAIIYVYDTEKKKLRYINKQITDILGYNYEDMGHWENGLMDVVFGEDVDIVKKELEKYDTLKDNDCHSYNCRLQHKTGDWRYFRTLGTALGRGNEGKASSLLFIAQDITHEMRTAEEARTIKELYTETEKTLNFGGWEWDLKKNRLEWTEGLCELMGCKLEEMPTQPDRQFVMQFVSESDLLQLQTLTQKAIETKSDFEFEYNMTTKNQEQKAVYSKGKVITGHEGEPVKVIGITRDITHVKLLEREREKNIEELNRSNRDLEEFAYVASHDLQEPLRKISTFTERLQAKFSDQLGDEGQVYVARILGATENMRLLIDNLLEFSRVTRIKQPFESTPLDRIVNEVLSDLELKVEESQAGVSINPLPMLEVMPTQIKQLFNNLLSNAIKFRNPGVAPVVSIASSKLTHSEKERLFFPMDKTYYKIVVADNGIGFEEEYAERIFQIFQRLHGKAEYPGSGIGLSICKKIADNHHGALYAKGELGKGAAFTIVLPEKQ